MSDKIPIITRYRGVGIFDCQSADRIKSIVEPEIDYIHSLSDLAQLIAFADDPANSPESRLFAAAKLRAVWEIAADERRVQPDIDFERVAASVAGLDSRSWRDPRRHCSLPDRAAVREVPLTRGRTAA